MVQDIQAAYRTRILEALDQGDVARVDLLRALRDEEVGQLLRLPAS